MKISLIIIGFAFSSMALGEAESKLISTLTRNVELNFDVNDIKYEDVLRTDIDGKRLEYCSIALDSPEIESLMTVQQKITFLGSYYPGGDPYMGPCSLVEPLLLSQGLFKWPVTFQITETQVEKPVCQKILRERVTFNINGIEFIGLATELSSCRS